MRVHLVDGTYELFRAHFSQRPGKTVTLGTGPMDVKATAGLVAEMLSLLHDPSEAVTHLAIAFDNPIVSFRNDLFDGYKSDEGVPPSLRAQFDLAEIAMRALGIVVWSMDRWEADDALATAAARFSPAVEQVRILTPDKDLGQCVQGTRVVQIDRMRRKLYDEDVVRAVRGVAPASIPDYLGLVGDTSDGIPGLAGFGAKSAAAVLSRWGTIERIPDDYREWDVKVTGAPRLAATLAAERDDAMLYKKLATLVTDVPLPESLAELEFRGVPRASFDTLCTQLDSQGLRSRAVRFRPASSLDEA
jgi:5'-3' exonuclease